MRGEPWTGFEVKFCTAFLAHRKMVKTRDEGGYENEYINIIVWK
jgi:hypothetical protein